MSKKILVTGGAGYIGSHTVVELLNYDYEVIVIDNFSNSNKKVIKVIEDITNKKVKVYEIDLKDEQAVIDVFKEEEIDAVIHFAGYKAVGESVAQPLMYYENNIGGTLNLLKAMRKFSVKNLVFSSSATVYGAAEKLPITEDAPVGAVNPYGRTKLYIEMILKDLTVSKDEWNIVALRYFNPLGAHPSGIMGEQPNGIPNNLVPYVSQVAIGKLDYVKVCGDDYDTPDGTGIRDYVHVMDLAYGHIKALEKIFTKPEGFEVYNLGSEKGYSVYEIIRSFEEATNKSIPYKVVERRPGDIAVSYASAEKAHRILNWQAKFDLLTMCKDTWRWQSMHPNGF